MPERPQSTIRFRPPPHNAQAADEASLLVTTIRSTRLYSPVSSTTPRGVLSRVSARNSNPVQIPATKTLLLRADTRGVRFPYNVQRTAMEGIMAGIHELKFYSALVVSNKGQEMAPTVFCSVIMQPLTGPSPHTPPDWTAAPLRPSYTALCPSFGLLDSPTFHLMKAGPCDSKIDSTSQSSPNP